MLRKTPTQTDYSERAANGAAPLAQQAAQRSIDFAEARGPRVSSHGKDSGAAAVRQVIRIGGTIIF